jgi:hypothetical protein
MIYSILALILSFGGFYFGLTAINFSAFAGGVFNLSAFFVSSASLFSLVGGGIIVLGGASGFLSSWKFVK